MRNYFPKRTADAPLHTLSKLHDDPIGFVSPLYCYICGRRRVTVARYRMIFLVRVHVLINFYLTMVVILRTLFFTQFTSRQFLISPLERWIKSWTTHRILKSYRRDWKQNNYLLAYSTHLRQWFALFAIAEGWLIFDIGWCVLLFTRTSRVPKGGCK